MKGEETKMQFLFIEQISLGVAIGQISCFHVSHSFVPSPGNSKSGGLTGLGQSVRSRVLGLLVIYYNTN